MKILISAGKSAKAFKVKNLLVNHELILADFGEMPDFVGTDYKFVSLGQRNNETLAHTILTMCLDLGVEACLPLEREEIFACSEAKILFEEFNIALLVPELEYLKSFNPIESADKNITILMNGEDLLTGKINNQLMGLSGIYYSRSLALKPQLFV